MPNIYPGAYAGQKMPSVIIFADGACRGNPGKSAIGVIAFEKENFSKSIFSISKYIGEGTNNQAEYSALIAGLEQARKMGLTSFEVKMDSKLVVEQLKGNYKVKNANLIPLYLQAKEISKDMQIVYTHIPREKNKEADALANRALDTLS